jgi:transposase
MGKPHPIELRERVVGHVDVGHTHRATAAHDRVSVKFVNDMVKPKRATGSLEPRSQRNPGSSRLGPFEGSVRGRLSEQGDLTLEAPGAELWREHGLKIARSGVGAWLHRLGPTHKYSRRIRI